MPTRFFISDTHFGHRNLLNFKRPNGRPLREKPDCTPFISIEEMNEFLIKNWNSVVGPNDIVYHCGDVALQSPNLDILYELKGQKRLILGNHDNQDISQYAKHFTRLNGAFAYDKFILTHIPVHNSQLERWAHNIHGHLHAHKMEDAHYINVSVEQINYTPISLDELKQRLK